MQLQDNTIEFPERSSIYAIINIITDKHYIGSAVNFIIRKQNHISALKRNDHKNPYLQSAWNKNWSFNFIFIKLEYCEIDKLIEREQWWIDRLEPEYNLCPIAGRRTGYISTEETKSKMSKALKGKKKTAEHIINNSIARRGWKHSEKTKEILRLGWAIRNIEGIGIRKLDKWPHTLGRRCKCQECKIKQNEYNRNWRAIKNAK